jgi:hypothetical protein
LSPARKPCILRAMFLRLLLPLLLLPYCAAIGAEAEFEGAPHDYWKRPLTDRFTRFKTELEAGRVKLDTSGEKPFLVSLLSALEIPASSQMLVFSTTSLQLRLISPRNPRALFFNEDVYVGYIPGGRIEIVSLDPALGGIFYIFDIPRGDALPRVERSERCMNCHARDETGNVPSLTVKSVLPGPSGGSLVAYRQGLTGHGIPFKDRFGGWYLTGAEKFADHWANTMGRFVEGKLQRIPVEPGRLFDFARYPMASSDVLPQLLHEHQVGFANRVIAATYRTRALVAQSGGKLTAAQGVELDEKARELVRYLLFAEEVPLPAGGFAGDDAFKADFAKSRRTVQGGASLKDFDLKTRLFRFRCSYMIYSEVFGGLPPEMRQRVDRVLARALNEAQPDKDFAYLPAQEKRAIRFILKATMKNPPAGI